MANRYKSKAVEADEYFPALVRYIHQKPVKADLAGSPGEYRWSSYRDYIEGAGLTDTDFLLSMVSSQELIALHEVMGEMEFTVSPGTRKTDDELRRYLARRGIEGPRLADTEFVLSMVSRQELIAFHEVMDEMEFTVSLGTRKTDDELRRYLARRGIEEPGSVAELSIKERNELVSRLKEEFSERQISRVTGLARGTVARIGS